MMAKKQVFVWNVVEYRKLLERIEKLEKAVFGKKKSTEEKKPRTRKKGLK